MTFRFGSYELNETLWELRRHGRSVAIQRKPFEMLLFLVRHRERVISRDELRAGVWPGTTVSDTAVRQVILQARRALQDAGGRWIQTVRGRGIRFAARVDEGAAETPGARQDALWKLAWRFQADQNPAAARQTLGYLVECNPKSRLARAAREILAQDGNRVMGPARGD